MILRYWDSTVFLAWLLPEAHRRKACQEVLREAKKGDVRILTSALTLVEVIKLKGNPMLKEDQEKLIHGFFLNSYISVRNVDRFIAEKARVLIWKNSVPPKDAIHIATALHFGAQYLDTFDADDMIRLSGKLGSPPLIIGHPHAEQPDLDFDTSSQKKS
jgi:predicted nucleic acid-binding protein